MDKHLIAIDLDGTTLNDQSLVDDITITTLRQLNDLGHQVMIATGRPLRNTMDIYDTINIEGPMINLNGAILHYPGRPNWLPTYQAELDLEIAFDLISRQEELGIELVIAEQKENLFSSQLDLPEEFFYSQHSPNLHQLNRDSLKENPVGLSVFTNGFDQEETAQKIRNLYGKKISVRPWGGEHPVLEVVSQGINKWYGVNKVRKFLHIPLENVITFGDQVNDLEMIREAGLGVAMSNAVDEVKAVAKAQTSYSNHEAGLARFLMEYFSL